jgi:hypothetical protein
MRRGASFDHRKGNSMTFEEKAILRELLPRTPQDIVAAEELNMNRILCDPDVVAMDGSTSTSLNSWLVLARGKACYTYVYYR